METKVYDVRAWDEEALKKVGVAAKLLKGGALVAFPTETVYGLGANAMDPAAVASIYEAKGRPSDNPLIVHVAELQQCKLLAEEWPETAQKLADAFWPGPLTMILPKRKEVPAVTTGGLSTVALRMPDHKVALELIRRSGCPVAAPSANLSGKPSPTTGRHVVEDMDGRVPLILIGEDCEVGIESTVLDLTGPVPMILRPGILTPEDLEKVLKIPVVFDPALYARIPQGEEGGNTSFGEDNAAPAPKAPGMKYRHYAPKAEMLVVKGPAKALPQALSSLKKEKESQGRKVGVIFFEDGEFQEAARHFFARLRQLDEEGVDLILAGAMDDENSLGFAIMNRMLKSASYKVMEIENL